MIREFVIPVKETNPFEQAQICAGGVDTTEIEAETMQSKRVPGLYMVGELLDVDGTCGRDTTCSGHGHPDMRGSLRRRGRPRIQKNCPGQEKQVKFSDEMHDGKNWLSRNR